ncbi:MAG: hypothetical protein JXC32_05385 [Anaerolineae bacterium]|nr:hypothetical protein [Anaerolineae bacterium]
MKLPTKKLQRGVGRASRLVLPLLLLLLALSSPAQAQKAGQRAGLVVVHGDGRVVTRCVAFDEPEISGSTLLARSGLSVVSSAGPLGQTICSLNGEGCPASACFCECTGTPCIYWVYYHQQPDGAWSYANIGAARRTVTHGDVDAWVWGEVSQLPPAVSFDAICGATAPATAPMATQEPATPAATGTPVPSPEPASTRVPLPTAVETVAPSPTLPPTPTVTGTPAPVAPVTPSPTPAASVPAMAVPVTPGPENATSDRTATPTATSSPGPSAAAIPEGEEAAPSAAPPSGGGQTQVVTFVIVLGTVAAAFFLLSRRSGP